MRHANAFEHVPHALFPLRAFHSAIRKRQFDIFELGEIADQIERLKNEPDLAIADAGAVRKRKAG
jgi:hypothetical protein